MALLTLVDDIVTATTNVQPAAATTYVVMAMSGGGLYDGSTLWTANPFSAVPYGTKVSINNSYYYRVETTAYYSFVSTTAITSITRASSVGLGASVNFQPSAATFWIVDKIVGSAGSFLYYYYDGSTAVLINPTGGAITSASLLFSNSYYLRVTEGSVSAGQVVISGKQTPSALTPAVALASMAGSASVTIQPTAGLQYMVLSGAGAQMEFYKYDGSTAVQFWSATADKIKATVPLTNSDYLRITNSDAGTQYYAVGYLQDM